MSTFAQRLLWRAVPVGVATALIGYGLFQFYISALQALTSATVEVGSGGVVQGPLIFGAIGFVLTASVECVRTTKKPVVRRQAQSPVAVP